MKTNKNETTGVPLRVIDLFAGVGGFRVGLQRANKAVNKEIFKVVWGNQWEPGIKTQHAAEIYKTRFKTTEDEFANVDINNIATKDIPNHDVIVAGFPCQDYSVATTKKLSGGIEGRKGVLWWQLERILREKGKNSAKYFIFENVDRLLGSPAKQRGRDFAIMLTCLNNLGYMVEWRVIDASQYGFPQRRKRIFFLGYRKGTKPYEQFSGKKKDAVEWLSSNGVFAKGFPIQSLVEGDVVEVDSIPNKKGSREEQILDIKDISNSFNKNGKTSPFMNSGIMKNGKVYTAKVKSNYKGKYMVLGDVLLDESEVPEEYFIPQSQLEKWEYLKGAKKEQRVSASNGHKYFYSEGAITYPDALNRASRTIITGEGGAGPSRFKHVVKTPSGRLRRLVPIELERLDMFDDNHTLLPGVSDSRRAFIMGNALVVGVVQRIGESLSKQI
jgi:DNA (cytosine-5)-methyltransferase 1